MKFFRCLFLCSLLLWWVPPGQAEDATIVLQDKRSWSFAEDGVTFSNEFSAARLNGCERIGALEYRLTISPENTPINPSPWYAFKVTSAKTQAIKLRFVLTTKGSVARPRLSKDGKTWTVIDPAAFATTPKSRQALVPELAVATIEAGPDTLWVAAQEIIGVAEMNAWMDAKAKLPFVRESVIGESLEGRPLRQLIFAETEKPDYVFILNRQHPPEITGTLAFMKCIETLAGDSDLARRYRQSFQTVVVPLMNPDGVEHGHWRHNRAGVDTNRDWKPFTQPETRAARDTMLKLGKAPKARVFLFLDFHSTSSDVFYGPPDDAETFPPQFAERWLGAFARRYPEYTFQRDNAHNVGVATSKGWAYDTFGCAGITYEIGYGTAREVIDTVSVGAAEEMMKTLLEEAAKSPP